MAEREKSEQRKRYEQLIAEWESSGKTQAEFCAERGVRLSAFRQWRYRGLRPRRASGPALVEVVLPAAATNAASFEVVLRSGVVVRVPARFEATALKVLLHALES